MNFEELYGRYRRGEASPEERAAVEEEREKFRLLMEDLDGGEPLLPPEPVQADRAAYRSARRAVRRRAVRMVLLAAAAACILAIGGPAVYRGRVVPWLNEKVYLNPTASTSGLLLTDLEIAVNALNELITPDWTAGGIRVETVGAGQYRLSVQRWREGAGTDWIAGTLDRGTFRFDEALFPYTLFAFVNDTCPFNGHGIPTPEEVLPSLEQLPDYVEVRAAVSFGRDLSMEELSGLLERYPKLQFGWTGVRAADLTQQRLPLVGFYCRRSGYLIDINDDYPYFCLADGGDDPAALESHFKSLLRYAADHPELVNPLLSEDPEAAMHQYFQERLDYVEEHGVRTYGSYVSGSPSELARLCGEADVCGVTIQDLRLTVPG